MAKSLMKECPRGPKEKKFSDWDLVNVMYSQLQYKVKEELWVYEALYYLDKLKNCYNSSLNNNSVVNGNDKHIINNNNKQIMETFDLKTMQKMFKIIIELMRIFPPNFKRVLFNFSGLKKFKQKYDVHPNVFSYNDPFYYKLDSPIEIIPGLYKWVLWTYFSMLMQFPTYTFNEFLTDLFSILSGDYDTVEKPLLMEFLNMKTTGFLLQSREFKNDDARERCNAYLEFVDNMRRCVVFENVTVIRPANRKTVFTPAMGSQVTVMTSEEKRLFRKLAKVQKKSKSDDEVRDLENDLDRERTKPLFNGRKIFIPPNPYENCPHVHMENSSGQAKGIICGKLMLIPCDSIRRSEELYDEITIPARKRVTKRTVPPVKIDTLDAIGRAVFQEIEEFNEIQSEVFPAAYRSNRNLLICAPTGAGKTNIALMTIVQQLKKSIEGNVLHLEKFKIVYVCPMKALAAEITKKFSHTLQHLGVKVREVTGDMQLSRKEIMETQILVTTPEKWDVITRKGAADTEITSLVKLLILDEVHLLNSDRGSVIEALVARTLRQVITSQSMIRIVGLSATIPNILDVADFLRVDRECGLFYFDQGYKSVPISMTFVGIKATRPDYVWEDEDKICFEKVTKFLEEGHQVMVFVHARNQTVRCAEYLLQQARKNKFLRLFQLESMVIKAKRFVLNAKQSFLKELFNYGLAVHHAGMPRTDRNDVERAFMAGVVRVLVCTSTLAWGVNLPAHAVIIKGTTLYDTKKSAYVDLDILDVMQIFGRAGRPQFDTSGSAVMITSQSKVIHYLRLITLQVPIESQFVKSLNDNLNAEVVLGTVTTVQDAVEWITFTYFYLRLCSMKTLTEYMANENGDPLQVVLDYIHKAAARLDKARMLRYNDATGDLVPTNLGRTASYFYINVNTVETINSLMMPNMTEAEILRLLSQASEFEQIQVRQEELSYLVDLQVDYCEFDIRSEPQNREGKVNILMQTYISKGHILCLSLAADMEYIIQSAQRIARALFEIAVHKSWPNLASRCLIVAQMFEHRMWHYEHLLKQFPELPLNITNHLQENMVTIEALREMEETEIGKIIHNQKYSNRVKRCAEAFPLLEVESHLQPITMGVVRVKLFIKPNFKWTPGIHGEGALVFWVWVEDPNFNTIYHFESFTITRSICFRDNLVELVFTVPLASPRPSYYLVRISSERWMKSGYVERIDFTNLKLPESYTQHTQLLPLQPLEVSVLNNPCYEVIFGFSHFNPVQTQIFHCLYHTDNNVLLGAPTGSGKTVVAELCMLRLFNNYPNMKVVYIAPLKALVRERVLDWKRRIQGLTGKSVIEVTGDVSVAYNVLQKADVIVTTPEKWDAMSRGWQNRDYVQDVGLMIIDEIHMLGEERGPVLEVIVSRTNFICDRTKKKIRIVGLSTAMANAGDLATWLGIGEVGLYNFHPSVRPVPLSVHVSGFPGKNYCPRMMSMNRPAYHAIRHFAPDSPTLIFCSSRKQTRLTAFALITYLLTDSNPRQWLKCDPAMIQFEARGARDTDLKHFLNFGIGIHHAGLQEDDRSLVERLYLQQAIQVLISTSTLAWGVNLPAHLVIIKGTEYYDGNLKRYVDMPITDILQMMGRAGRPQFDTSGVACVYVQDLKKNFYKKFLYEPFPVESNLLEVLPDHVNAEIVAGTVPTQMQLVEYLTWTYLFRRLHENPSYYNFNCKVTLKNVNLYLTALVNRVVEELVKSRCVISEIGDDLVTYYEPTFLGTVACYYYLSHQTVFHFSETMRRDCSIADLIEIMAFSKEYAIFPVRHNEDKTNKDLAAALHYKTNIPMDSPHLKVILLTYAYLNDLELPTREYVVDTKGVLDQALRILQGMLDIATNSRWLSCALRIIHILQMILQGQWLTTSCLIMLPGVHKDDLPSLYKVFSKYFKDVRRELTLPILKKLFTVNRSKFQETFVSAIGSLKTAEIVKFIINMPLISFTVKSAEEESEPQELSLTSGKLYRFKANASVDLEFGLKRRGGTLNAHCAKYGKQKDESWVLLVGLPQEDELLAMKRLIVKREKSVTLKIKMPPKKGDYMMCIYLLSDSYIGLDQQYLVNVTVI